MNHKIDMTVEAAKVAPAGAVLSTPFFGIALEQWVFGATLVYTVMLIIHKAWAMHRDFTGKGDDDEA